MGICGSKSSTAEKNKKNVADAEVPDAVPAPAADAVEQALKKDPHTRRHGKPKPQTVYQPRKSNPCIQSITRLSIHRDMRVLLVTIRSSPSS